MKKFLLTAVLIVAVLTSLTAGTLASYYQEQTIDGNVKPMYFAFTKAGIQGFNTTVKLAPGQSQVYAVDVKNLSEMQVAFTASSLFSGSDFKDVLTANWCTDIGGGTPAAAPSFSLGNGYSLRLFLKVTWDDGKTNPEKEVQFSQASDSLATLHVSIKGTSV